MVQLIEDIVIHGDLHLMDFNSTMVQLIAGNIY